MPKVEKLTAQRISHAGARLKEHTLEELSTLFKRLDDSDLAQKWGSFDWITKSEQNLAKVREGHYDNRRGTNGLVKPELPTATEYLEARR